jgi:hypothetical protein
MKITLRDLYVLLDCAKFVLRIHGENLGGYSRDDIKKTVEKIINDMDIINLEIKNE